MKTIRLNLQPLTQSGFDRFGDVVETQGHSSEVINSGYATKYSNLAGIDTSEGNGKAAIHIFVAKKRQLPLKIDMLERHQFFSQCFIPRAKEAFLIVVAPPADEPDIDKIKAFISDGEQGVNFARGVWHFPLISLYDGAQFITIDRNYDPSVDTIEQCDIFEINNFDITLEIS